MSRSDRLALISLAVVAAVGAFFALRPDDDGAERAARTTQRTTAEQTGRSPQATRTTRPTPPAPPLIVVRGGEPVGGVHRVTVRKGQRVRFTVASDSSDEVHVHGYDRSVPVGPARRASVSFRATIEGVFEVELEQRGVEIAQLEVRP